MELSRAVKEYAAEPHRSVGDERSLGLSVCKALGWTGGLSPPESWALFAFVRFQDLLIKKLQKCENDCLQISCGCFQPGASIYLNCDIS